MSLILHLVAFTLPQYPPELSATFIITYSAAKLSALEKIQMGPSDQKTSMKFYFKNTKDVHTSMFRNINILINFSPDANK